MKYLLFLLSYFAISTLSVAQTMTFETGDRTTWTWDCDTIVRQSEHTHIYKYTNKGSVPLLIKSMKRSSIFARIKYSKEPLLPNQEAEIILSLNTEYTGRHKTYITLRTNDPEREYIRFEVKGTVIE